MKNIYYLGWFYEKIQSVKHGCVNFCNYMFPELNNHIEEAVREYHIVKGEELLDILETDKSEVLKNKQTHPVTIDPRLTHSVWK